VRTSLNWIACPSSRLCVAVGAKGTVLTATRPAGGTRAWHHRLRVGKAALLGVTCASRSLSVLFNATGSTWRSSEPAARRAGAWRGAGLHDQSLTAVSCASTLCAAVDQDGTVLTIATPLAATSPAQTATGLAPDRDHPPAVTPSRRLPTWPCAAQRRAQSHVPPRRPTRSGRRLAHPCTGRGRTRAASPTIPVLTDTLDGDDGAIEDGDLGDERPNDQRVVGRSSDGNGATKGTGFGGRACCVARL
jgi:hypothetical protein